MEEESCRRGGVVGGEPLWWAEMGRGGALLSSGTPLDWCAVALALSCLYSCCLSVGLSSLCLHPSIWLTVLPSLSLCAGLGLYGPPLCASPFLTRPSVSL